MIHLLFKLTGKSFIVICLRIPFLSMMNKPLKNKEFKGQWYRLDSGVIHTLTKYLHPPIIPHSLEISAL